jgi:RNA polymerase sigma-70 factor (ECF subfamily)
VALSDIDRNLLERCLARKPRAWEDFVDRFTGLVIHVVNHTARCRSIMLSSTDREDLTAEVLLAVVRDDFAVLRHFRGKSSLATYLTVVARRVVVRRLVESRSATQLMEQLDENEATVVRMYHLEGKSYQEISRSTGLATNSVGPMLSRARTKLREVGARRSHA